MEPWFALEAACARWDRQEGSRQFLCSLELGEDATPSGVTYGRELFGGGLEFGYREKSRSYVTQCPECERWRLFRSDYERAEGGSLNFYYDEFCDACGYSDEEAWR